MLETDFLLGLALLAAGMAATGLIGGILAGLLGIGGGIVIVPVMAATLEFLHVADAVVMHVAVATSLATIILTSLSSARAHYRRGSLDWALVRAWGPALGLGAIAGALTSAFIDADGMRLVFGLAAIAIAVFMFTVGEGRPRPASLAVGRQAASFGIGGISALMGIGGGVLSVPFLTQGGVPVRTAIGTASFFGFLIAVPGTAGFIFSGWDHAGLPAGSFGYVNLIGLALITPFTMLTAPLGARISHAIAQRTLRYLFAAFVLLAAGNMLISALV